MTEVERHLSFLIVIACSVCTSLLPSVLNAQTSYSIDFANQTSCDVKVSALIDVPGNNCASQSPAGSLFLASGTTTTFNFTVPSGYQFCCYMFTADPNTGGPYYYTTGANPCAWNFTGVDLCNNGPPNVSGKGNCTSARLSQ